MDSSKFLRIHRSSSAAPIPSCGTCSNICVLNSLMTCFTVYDILLIHIYITLRNCMYVLIFNYIYIHTYNIIYVNHNQYDCIILHNHIVYIYIYYIACTYYYSCTVYSKEEHQNLVWKLSPRNGPWVRP